MTSRKFRCPLCQSQLSKERWLEVTRLWEEQDRLIAEAEKRGTDKERRRTSYLQNLLRKRDEEQEKLREQNRELRQQLKRGTTPQMEGLLYEKELCRQLQNTFPSDKVTHHGKGGDVMQQVLLHGRKVGRFVFECKRVQQRLPKQYIEQARRALVERKADYAILVTNAGKANTFGFWTEKDVLIVHPAGVVALVSWLRDQLVKLAQARMTRRQREQAAKAILEFVDSPEFRNPLRDVVRRSEQLGHDLLQEKKMHHRIWLERLTHYYAIWAGGLAVGRGFDRILERHSLHAAHGKLVPQTEKHDMIYPVRKETLLLPGKRG